MRSEGGQSSVWCWWHGPASAGFHPSKWTRKWRICSLWRWQGDSRGGGGAGAGCGDITILPGLRPRPRPCRDPSQVGDMRPHSSSRPRLCSLHFWIIWHFKCSAWRDANMCLANLFMDELKRYVHGWKPHQTTENCENIKALFRSGRYVHRST